MPNGISFYIRTFPQCVYEQEYYIYDEKGNITGTTTRTVDRCALIYMDVNNIENPNQFGADIYRYDVLSDATLKCHNKSSLDKALLYNKIEYTPFNIGDEAK